MYNQVKYIYAIIFWENYFLGRGTIQTSKSRSLVSIDFIKYKYEYKSNNVNDYTNF